MNSGMKIGELANATGLTTKTIRYYELNRLLGEPRRTDSGYRLYDSEAVERLEFIKKAKNLGLSLEEIRDILVLYEQRLSPCVHVLALLDRKLEQLDNMISNLDEFRRELLHLRLESQVRLEQLSEESRICGIIESGIDHKGEVPPTLVGGFHKRI